MQHDPSLPSPPPWSHDWTRGDRLVPPRLAARRAHCEARVPDALVRAVAEELRAARAIAAGIAQHPTGPVARVLTAAAFSARFRGVRR